MSDYSVVPGGSLKFKGDDGKKKKKKKSHAPEERKQLEADVAIAEKRRDKDREQGKERDEEDRERRERRKASASASPAPARSGSGSASPAPGGPRMTDAERRFEEVMRKRREDRAKKEAHLTHRDRVNALNKKLDQLSEHHDMPKIGPG